MEVLNSFDNFVFLASLLQSLYFANGQEILTIFRNPGNGGPWTDLDKFKLPDSKCSSMYCTNWKAHPLRNTSCHCQCSYSQEATFGFYSGSWTCLANTEVRKQTECKYKFESEAKINYPLPIVEKHRSYHLILPSKGCSVKSKTTRYFTCNGSWAGIDSKSWFSITRKKKLDSPTPYRYKLVIKSHVDDVLRGRIISLNINCANQDPSCLLFKFKGTLHCAENVTFATTDKIPIPATASAVPNATAIPNESGKKEKSKASGGSSTVVGVVVTLMIILVIAILIVVYVYRKRKRGEAVWLVDYISFHVRKTKSTQAKKKTVDETQEDPVYAEIPEEQLKNEPPVDQAGGIYSYAFDDPQTAYIAPQPAPYNRLEHKQQGLNQEGALYSTADDGPVYNVLERPLAENNIIMAPENTVNEGPPSQVLEPEYHVLEGPDTTSANTDV